MKSTPIRTRFAPSPTGYLHIGGARTALFNYLYAHANKGKFILRIEDTDQERSTPEAEKWILESLDWLGLKADEGPEQGGNFGPYRQSERLSNYKKYTQQLLDSRLAYLCFCSDEELKEKQAQAKVIGKPYIYDGKCRGLSDQEIQNRKQAGQKYTIRFRTEAMDIVVDDIVQGKVKFDARLIGDFIIVKSNGFPSYNYAVVIDDYEMKISHVIRGVGHLSNTPRQVLLYKALGLDLPHYAHISEIIGTNHKKLSKRQGATSVMTFGKLGYLADALINYMALLGWYPRDGVERMLRQDLEKKFDVQHCSKSPAMFDFFLSKDVSLKARQNQSQAEQEAKSDQDRETSPQEGFVELEELALHINKKSKLNWLNNYYLRETPLESLWPIVQNQVLEKDSYLAQMLDRDEAKLKHGFDCIRQYLSTYVEALPYLKELFHQNINIESPEAREFFNQENSRKISQAFLENLHAYQPETPDQFSEVMRALGESFGLKGRSLYMPIRIASTGSMQGLELPILFSILGWQRVCQRLETILNTN